MSDTAQGLGREAKQEESTENMESWIIHSLHPIIYWCILGSEGGKMSLNTGLDKHDKGCIGEFISHQFFKLQECLKA